VRRTELHLGGNFRGLCLVKKIVVNAVRESVGRVKCECLVVVLGGEYKCQAQPVKELTVLMTRHEWVRAVAVGIRRTRAEVTMGRQTPTRHAKIAG
jgi:hypothetical protein